MTNRVVCVDVPLRGSGSSLLSHPDSPLPDELRQQLLVPERLWSGVEIAQTNPCPIPQQSGVYAWYFKNLPSTVPLENCVWHGDFALLYVGISPATRPIVGVEKDRQNLRKRIRTHLRGNASGSTLRLTLGCLLSRKLGISLRRVGARGRLTFAEGESILSTWMSENASVIWSVHPEPWLFEHHLIELVSPPLNLRHNAKHPFYHELSAIREVAKQRVRELPIV
jgi:hypothetical protein